MNIYLQNMMIYPIVKVIIIERKITHVLKYWAH